MECTVVPNGRYLDDVCWLKGEDIAVTRRGVTHIVVTRRDVTRRIPAETTDHLGRH